MAYQCIELTDGLLQLLLFAAFSLLAARLHVRVEHHEVARRLVRALDQAFRLRLQRGVGHGRIAFHVGARLEQQFACHLQATMLGTKHHQQQTRRLRRNLHTQHAYDEQPTSIYQLETLLVVWLVPIYANPMHDRCLEIK